MSFRQRNCSDSLAYLQILKSRSKHNVTFYDRNYIIAPPILNDCSTYTVVHTSSSLMPQGRRVSLKMVELARKVGESLSSIRQKDTVVKSNFMDIVIYKEKPEDFGGQMVSEGSTSVLIPDSTKAILPNTNESLSLQVRKEIGFPM